MESRHWLPAFFRLMNITCHVIEAFPAIDMMTSWAADRSLCISSQPSNQESAMQKFIVHTIESAPQASQQTLQGLTQKFGFLPNVMATMAASPVLLNGFVGGFSSFHGGSLNECEKQVLLLSNAVALQCPWTVAAHSTFALEDGIAQADVLAMRQGQLPADPKYAALSAISKALIESRGKVDEADIERFVSAGYTRIQLFEVITSIGISTMAATTTNMANTPVEARFQAQAWAPA
jgi:alkylhydroperoxidase family enzyme